MVFIFFLNPLLIHLATIIAALTKWYMTLSAGDTEIGPYKEDGSIRSRLEDSRQALIEYEHSAWKPSAGGIQ